MGERKFYMISIGILCSKGIIPYVIYSHKIPANKEITAYVKSIGNYDSAIITGYSEISFETFSIMSGKDYEEIEKILEQNEKGMEVK